MFKLLMFNYERDYAKFIEETEHIWFEKWKALPKKQRIGTIFIWRNFKGAIVESEHKPIYVGLPETAVTYWLNDGEDLLVLSNKYDCSFLKNPDRGVPLFSLPQFLQLFDFHIGVKEIHN